MGDVGSKTRNFRQSQRRGLIDGWDGLSGGGRLAKLPSAAVVAFTGRAPASQHVKEALPHGVGAFSQPQPSKNNIPSCEQFFDTWGLTMGLGKRLAKQGEWLDCRAKGPTDEPPMTMPQSDLPHAPVVQEEQQIDAGYVDVAEEGGDPTQPGDLPIPTTQESDKRVSLATVTRKFRAKFTGRGSSTGERATRNRLTKRPYISKSLTDLVNSVVKEQSQLVLSVESDGSNSFSAPQTSIKRTSSGNADRWILIDGAEGTPDEFPPLEPVDVLPIDASEVGRHNDNGHTGAIENARDSAKPEDLTIRTTQKSEKHVSLHDASVTPPLPSRPEVTGQDDFTGLQYPTEVGVLGERTVKEPPTDSELLTDAVTSTVEEESQYVAFVNG